MIRLIKPDGNLFLTRVTGILTRWKNLDPTTKNTFTNMNWEMRKIVGTGNTLFGAFIFRVCVCGWPAFHVHYGLFSLWLTITKWSRLYHVLLLTYYSSSRFHLATSNWMMELVLFVIEKSLWWLLMTNLKFVKKARKTNTEHTNIPSVTVTFSDLYNQNLKNDRLFFEFFRKTKDFEDLRSQQRFFLTRKISHEPFWFLWQNRSKKLNQ